MIPFEDPGSSLRKYLFLAGGVVCLLIAFSLTALFSGKFAHSYTPKEDPTEFESPTALAEEAVSADRWVIYITGAVTRPGVYEVPAGARVNDALSRAGGFSFRADPEGINLAAKLQDGVHIRVPETGESPKETQRTVLSGTAPTATAPAQSQPSPYAISPASAASKIDINRASASELQSLPHIGPKLAQTIVDYRTANGPFRVTEELMEVRGIGKKRFEAIEALVTVAP